MKHRSHAEWWSPELVDERGPGTEVIPAAEPKAPDSAVPFWGLMSFTFVLLIAPQTWVPALAPFRIALLSAAVAIGTSLFQSFAHRRPIMRLTREVQITIGLVGWAMLTVPLSHWPGGSVSFLLDIYFKSLAIFWLLSHVVNTPTRLRLVAWGLTLMSALVAVSGVKQYLSGNFIAAGKVQRIVGYEAALTGNPNDLALMLNLVLPLSVGLLLVNRRTFVRILLLAIIALQVSAIVTTFSRGGFLTLATIFVLYLGRLLKRPGRGWALAALVVGLACIPFLPSSYLARLSTITDIQSDPTGSAQARWNDTVAAMGFVAQNPLIGAGVGMNILALNEVRGAAWTEVHNVYLEYAVDLGIPGLVLFLLLCFGCLQCARFVQRRSAGVPTFEELFYLAEGIQISLVGFAVAALFYPVAYHFFFYYMAGLAIAVRAVYEAEERKAAGEPGSGRSSVAGLDGHTHLQGS